MKPRFSLLVFEIISVEVVEDIDTCIDYEACYV